MKQRRIEDSTILLPFVIAEGAFWDALEKLGIPENRQRDYNLQLEICPILEEKAHHLYNNNSWFRKKITSSEKGRNLLWSFMEHWAFAILKDKSLTN